MTVLVLRVLLLLYRVVFVRGLTTVVLRSYRVSFGLCRTREGLCVRFRYGFRVALYRDSELGGFRV